MIHPNIPLCDLASLNWVSHRVPSSPALWSSGGGNSGIEPFSTGGQPLCGAFAENRNRHLKSLRNKRKKTRKSSAKRAREKDRRSKKSILSP